MHIEDHQQRVSHRRNRQLASPIRIHGVEDSSQNSALALGDDGVGLLVRRPRACDVRGAERDEIRGAQQVVARGESREKLVERSGGRAEQKSALTQRFHDT